MKNFYIILAVIIVVGLAASMVKYVYYSPYNRCIRPC